MRITGLPWAFSAGQQERIELDEAVSKHCEGVHA